MKTGGKYNETEEAMTESASSSAANADSGLALLLLGCERSGTTFVMETLSRYYQVAYGNESPWVVEKWAEGKQLSDVVAQERFLKSIFGNWYFANKANYHGIFFDYKQFRQEGRFDYPLFVDQVFRYMAAEENAKWVLNKTCDFCENMPIVDEVFYQPRVVHLIRDGRDVGLSLLRIKAWGPISVYGAARWWAGRVGTLQQYAAEHMSGRYLEVRYEEMVLDPAATFERIAKFYGIFDRARHAQLAENVVTKMGNIEKWRSGFSPRQLEVYERVAGPVLEANGYQLVTALERLTPLPGALEAALQARESLFSRVGFYPLWFRGLRVINRLVSGSPRLQQRFYRSALFRNHFNWNKNMAKRAKGNGK